MAHGIPFGTFQICKEENRPLVAPALQEVVTNSGKCWKFPGQPYCLFAFPEPHRVSG